MSVAAGALNAESKVLIELCRIEIKRANGSTNLANVLIELCRIEMSVAAGALNAESSFNRTL